MNAVIGIDPGLSGAYCAMDKRTKKILEMHKFTNFKNFKNFLKKYPAAPVVIEMIYMNPGDAKRCKSATKLLHNAGGYYGILSLSNRKHEQVHPNSWQRKHLGQFKSGESKKAAALKAKKIWPKEKFLRTPRCTTPDDGLVDAALLAYHAATIF